MVFWDRSPIPIRDGTQEVFPAEQVTQLSSYPGEVYNHQDVDISFLPRDANIVTLAANGIKNSGKVTDIELLVTFYSLVVLDTHVTHMTKPS